MTEDLETKLQEFEEWLVEERYANKTILNTKQSLRYATHFSDLDDQDSIKRFINETERRKGNQTANEYIKSFMAKLAFSHGEKVKLVYDGSTLIIEKL